MAAPAASPPHSDNETCHAFMLRGAEARAAGIALPATATQAYAAGALPPPKSASPGLHEALAGKVMLGALVPAMRRSAKRARAPLRARAHARRSDPAHSQQPQSERL